MKAIIHNRKIDAVIFDMDGTFYPITFYQEIYYRFAILAVNTFLGLRGEKCEDYLKENGILPNSNPITARSLTDLIINAGVSINEWNEFRNNNFVLTGFEKTETVSLNALMSIKEKADLFLMTNNTKYSTKRILQELSIPFNLFKEVFSSENLLVNNRKMTKEYGYRMISDKYSLSYTKMLAVGDRFLIDLKPLIDLGGNGILVNNPIEINNIADLIQ